MPIDLPLAWERALSASDPLKAARALCSVRGWETLRDRQGRNVWMFSLAHGLGGTWPQLASRPGAWEAFGASDSLGRTVWDYLLTYGLPSHIRLSSWAEEAGERLARVAAVEEGVAKRLLDAPLPWPSAASMPPALRHPWSSRLPVGFWRWDRQADDEKWPWLICQDVLMGGNLWAWVRPFDVRELEKIPLSRRWVFLAWGGALGHRWPSSAAVSALEQRRVVASDALALAPCVKAWIQSPGQNSPLLKSLLLDLSLGGANGNGRRSARL